MRILICNDGTENSNGILDDLRHAGLGKVNEVHVLTVTEPFGTIVDTAPSVAIADAFANELSETFPEWSVTTITASGNPAREIMAAAEQLDADLIVIGEPIDDPDRQHIFLGETSSKVVNEASCSVRISRSQLIEPADSVVVAFDGSKASVAAVEQVAARSWPKGTKVKLVVVADSFLLDLVGRFAPQMNSMVVETRLVSQWASTLAANAIRKLRTAGLEVSIDVRSGRPQSTIVVAAEQFGANCIFVGPHNGPDSFARFVVGSVSAAVAKHANCSVEIVRTT